MSSIADRRRHPTTTPDLGVVVVYFAFQINGTSNPDNARGDAIASRAVTRAAAGKFTFTLPQNAYQVLSADGGHSGGDATDFTVDVDPFTTMGTVTVRCKTGGTLTDPGDNTWVSGYIALKTESPRAGA